MIDKPRDVGFDLDPSPFAVKQHLPDKTHKQHTI